MSRNHDWMQIAKDISVHATCDRKHVGAVVVDFMDNAVAFGHNDSLPGMPNCDHQGHQMVDGHCVRTVHAEAMAVSYSAFAGKTLRASTAYVTTQPCWTCFKLLFSSGIKRIFYGEQYGSQEYLILMQEAAEKLGIVFEHQPIASP